MKKLNLLIFVLLVGLICTVGCVKRDSMEDIEIITSAYPIEYLVNEIYGEHADIENIFPDGEVIDNYDFNNKQLNNFSDKDLFVYNGENSSDIALSLINRNDNLLLIDSTLGMEYTYGNEELWLDPSNVLMMALNIKNGLEEYVSNSYLVKEIDDNYQDLKVSLSELDAEFKLTVQNADNSKIVVYNQSLMFLEKYGFKVTILNDVAIDKTQQDVKTLVKNGDVKYIFMFEEDEPTEELKSFLKTNQIEIVYLYRLDSIRDEQRNNDDDYISIMEDNLETLKLEIYNKD